MPRATSLKRVGGRLVSAKSKTGNPECSAAMSVWVRGRKGGSVPSSVFATLGKCRAQARQNRSAAAKQASGKLATGRGTWQRSERAKSLLAQRAQRNATRDPKVFADRVHAAVASVPKSRQVGGKAWIHDAHAAYEKAHGSIPIERFKAGLVKANQARKLDMSRADMVEAYKPSDVAGSSTKHMGAEWNFVRVPEKPKAAAKTKAAPKPAAPPRPPSRISWSLAAAPSAPKPGAGQTARRDRLRRAGARPGEEGPTAFERAKKAIELKKARQFKPAAKPSRSTPERQALARDLRAAHRTSDRDTRFDRVSSLEGRREAARAASSSSAGVTAAHKARLDSAFRELDQANRGTNFVDILALRRKFPDLSRPQFDAMLREARIAGKFTLNEHEGLAGKRSKAQRKAVIKEAGTKYAYVSRRQ